MKNEQIYVLGDLTYPGSPLAPQDTSKDTKSPPQKARPAAVAGRFYPADPTELAAMVDRFITDAATWMGDDLKPDADQTAHFKAMISPHAGYVFSGPIAGSGYLWLKAAAERIKKVVLIGPAHYKSFEGVATISADAMASPLGDLPVDRPLLDKAMQLPFVAVNDEAHAPEHGLEVHLPFLQRVLGTGDAFTVAPFIFSRTDGQRVGELIEALWGGPETLILVSSDLSHFYNYDDANTLDHAACEAIEQFDPVAIKEEQACGRLAIQGLLHVGPSHNLHVKTLDLRNSGDTAGSKDRVVGYGSWVFF